tara:strand:+ start:576 stop:785 length:210 start_codon:yes stop_codon:yes gene_type:complete
MSNYLREGDKVYMTHRMNIKGLVTEIFFHSVKANTGPGTLSKQMFVRFRRADTGEIVVAKRQDLTKDNT